MRLITSCRPIVPKDVFINSPKRVNNFQVNYLYCTQTGIILDHIFIIDFYILQDF